MIEQMLVTRGLNELKLLDSRIHRKIGEAEFVGAAKVAAVNIDGKTTKEAYKMNAKADYQSLMELIKRRNRIKSAIIASNAVTMVEVAGKRMTVAEAINKWQWGQSLPTIDNLFALSKLLHTTIDEILVEDQSLFYFSMRIRLLLW